MDAYRVVVIIYFSFLFFLGCVGNGFLLAVFWKNRTYSSVIVFIKALAITDFYVCFTMPVGIVYWLRQEHGGLEENFCKIFQFTIGTGYTLTFCLIFLVALDRYLAIYHTEKSLFSVTVSHANILVLSAWILCHVGNLIKVVFGQFLQIRPGVTFCAEDTEGAVYITYSFLAFIFVLCCIVVIWINFQIIQAVKRQSQTIPIGNAAQRANRPAQGVNGQRHKDGGPGQMTVIELDKTNMADQTQTQDQTKSSNKTANESKLQTKPRPKRAKRSKVITSLTKMLAVTTLVYVATTLPTIIIFFIPLDTEHNIALNYPLLYAVYLLLKYLFFIDSVTKPFIYYAVSRTFREQVRDFIKQISV